MTGLPRTRSVAVAGSGIAALAAAVAFRRGLPDAEITLFADGEEEDDYPGAAAPFIRRFHRLVGLDEELFRSRTAAVAVLEADVVRGEAAPFRFVPLDGTPYVDGAALHQLWLRRRAYPTGASLPWSDVARRANTVGAPGLGVRFDANAYRSLLAEFALGIGVTIAREKEDTAGLSAEFDLVVSSNSCPEDRVTIEGLPNGLEWSFSPAPQASGPIEHIVLAPEEVVWVNPAWGATARPKPSTTCAGRIVRAMDGNVLRVGRAAVQCETFDGQPLVVALAGIARALELLPRPGAGGHEAAEYSRRSAIVHDFLLDWAAAKWGLPPGTTPGLAALRGQFAQRGRVPFRDDDPVPPGHWISWLIGCGELPRQIDPTAMAVSEANLTAVFGSA